MESDLVTLLFVRSALEVAVVGFVVIIIFFELQKKNVLPNDPSILLRQRHPTSSPPQSPPGYSAIPLGRPLGLATRARLSSSSVSVVVVVVVVCRRCVVRRTQEGGIEHQAHF